MFLADYMPCQWFPHTGGSIPLRISRYINAINNRATTICKDMRICAGQMWSALFKYILTTAVMCASQSLSSTEKDYIEDGKKNRLSFVWYRRRGARCATMRLPWIKKDQAIFRVHICRKLLQWLNTGHICRYRTSVWTHRWIDRESRSIISP